METISDWTFVNVAATPDHVSYDRVIRGRVMHYIGRVEVLGNVVTGYATANSFRRDVERHDERLERMFHMIKNEDCWTVRPDGTRVTWVFGADSTVA